MTHRDETRSVDVPPRQSELDGLEPLIGTWKSADHTLDGIYGPGVPVTNHETFHWLEGGYFLVQTYHTTFGDAPPQIGINYWFYDTAAARFRIIFFSNNGPFTEDGNRYEGKVDGDGLTFVGPAKFRYQLDTDRRIKLDGAGKVTVDWWVRDEGGTYHAWMTNVFERVG